MKPDHLKTPLTLLPACHNTLILLLASGWDLLAYKRSLSSSARGAQLHEAADTGKLEEGHARQIKPASMTEETTRHLEPDVNRSDEL